MQEYQAQLTALEEYTVERGADETGAYQLTVGQRATLQAYATQVEVGQVGVSFEQKPGVLLVAGRVIQVRKAVPLA